MAVVVMCAHDLVVINLLRLVAVSGRCKMERGISKAAENEYLIHQARNQVQHQFQASSPDSPDMYYGCHTITSGSTQLRQPGFVAGGFIDTPICTFTLPDLTIYSGQCSVLLFVFHDSFIAVPFFRRISRILGKGSDRAFLAGLTGAEQSTQLVGGNGHWPKAMASGHHWRW